jgi:hypothetical protein
VQHLAGALDRPEQRRRVHLSNRQQPQRDGGDDAEVSAAAAHRPKQIRVLISVHSSQPAVGRHDVEGHHAVARQPMLAGKPADPTANDIADHARVRRGAGEHGEAVIRGGTRNL